MISRTLVEQASEAVACALVGCYVELATRAHGDLQDVRRPADFSGLALAREALGSGLGLTLESPELAGFSSDDSRQPAAKRLAHAVDAWLVSDGGLAARDRIRITGAKRSAFLALEALLAVHHALGRWEAEAGLGTGETPDEAVMAAARAAIALALGLVHEQVARLDDSLDGAVALRLAEQPALTRAEVHEASRLDRKRAAGSDPTG